MKESEYQGIIISTVQTMLNINPFLCSETQFNCQKLLRQAQTEQYNQNMRLTNQCESLRIKYIWVPKIG